MKKCMITALILVIIGLVLGLIGGIMCKFNFRGLSTVPMVDQTYEVPGDFDSIKINGYSENIILKYSDSDKVRVECVSREGTEYTVGITDGILLVCSEGAPALKRYFAFTLQEEKITVYVPQKEFDSLSVSAKSGNVSLPSDMSFNSMNLECKSGNIDVKSACSGKAEIKTDSGEAKLENISCGSLKVSVESGKVEIENVVLSGAVDIEVTSGKIELENVETEGDVTLSCTSGEVQVDDLKCGNFTSTGNSGNANIGDCLASGKIKIRRESGAIFLKNSDASELELDTVAGDIKGTLRSGKRFEARSKTGEVNVPVSENGGDCTINTVTGFIHFTIE